MLRKRKNRRYNEENNDEEDNCERKFDIQEQIKSERFDQISDKHLQELDGHQITLRLIQKDGFDKPILVSEPDGLDLRVPPKTFLVRDIRDFVGGGRIIDVMDVKTQKNIEMTMRDWCKYYESRNRSRLLNVISLEFSHTPLDGMVEAPSVVRLLDWVDLVWPKFLKESQTESTNTITTMKYPKVQKYCLMSVKGSYTDFHIDFGGTSVWYHILRGRKIFWMVPPTELNLQIFEEWTLSGMQQDVFFGDTVEECFRVELCAGNTFFIPSGWIHAVYTLEDSLVFGGNFLHSFGIENQLKVSKIEDATKVPIKFRYPFYTEILWYVVQHYVHCLADKDHLHRPEQSIDSEIKAGGANNNTDLNSNKSKKNEIEDESTESEYEESDNRKSSSTTKRKRGRPPKSSTVQKKTKKPSTEVEDDDSTDIDSTNEDAVEYLLNKSNSKPANTCRMTKNSLLRLQYEVDEADAVKSVQRTTANKSDTNPQNKGVKRTPAESSQAQVAATHSPTTTATSTSIANASLNSTELSLNSKSKLNGWSASGGGGWSKLDEKPDDHVRKIHITKYEISGLKILVKHLSKLSGAKKNLPNLIRNSRALLDDCRKLIVEHENDDQELALTGKPITKELSKPKTTDMNELIGQFFKPIENAKPESDDLTNESPVKPKDRYKFITSNSGNLNGPSGRPDESTASVGDQNNSSQTSPSKISSHQTSPHKETKCLSPAKKSSVTGNSSSSTSTTGSSASPSGQPTRPKSPPTRPLSNNQYTSKTAKNFSGNNLLLPGSFADLIAATSTEKKVFDVNGSEVASSLFGSPLAKTSPLSSKQNTSSKHSNKQSSSAAKSIPSGDILTSISTTSSSSGQSGQTATSVETAKQPPPNPQKRFINPAMMRPQNKEKLIFASAPYISPIHATDQTRNLGTHYPWQSPAPTPVQPAAPVQYPPPPTAPSTHNPPTYSPQVANTATRPAATPSTHSLPHVAHPCISPEPRSHPPVAATMNHSLQTSSGDSVESKLNSQQFRPSQDTGIKREPIDSSAKIESTPPAEVSSRQSEVPQSSKIDELLNDDNKNKIKPVAKPRGPPKKSKEARQAIIIDQNGPSAVQPTISQSSSSVIKSSPSIIQSTTAPTSVPNNNPQSASTSTSMIDNTQTTSVPTKPKHKRAKKEPKNSTNPSSTINQMPAAPSSTLTASRTGQSIICGLVTPSNHPTAGNPTNANGVGAPFGTKLSPQSYLISRPLLFNTMPTFSATQLQQASRPGGQPLPLLTNPIGLPLQQGARIVWATQPRQSGAPVTSASSNLAQLPNAMAVTSATNLVSKPIAPVMITSQAPNAVLTTRAPSAGASSGLNSAAKSAISSTPPQSNHDNAALLSLATTALSTAPMISTPALSQLSSRAPAPQAIMVSGAAGAAAAAAAAAQQSALFAGQQFLRHPFVQRMPMTHFLARPGGTVGAVGRPQLGQLIYASLPNPNQSQPRYLITQPGFMQQRFPQPPHLCPKTRPSP